MQTLTEHIIGHGLKDRILKVSQIKRMVEGSAQSRYNLVNRAVKSGELIRFQRGLYVLDERFRDYPCHPFAFAQALAPGSYISFETALAYHGWIPETVFTIASVVPGRKSRQFIHDRMGEFRFYPMATRPGSFLELVNRHKIDGQTMLVAEPCRALMDLVCLRKLNWEGIGFLLEGLRIDAESLSTINKNDIEILQSVYKHSRVVAYLDSLGSALREIILE